MEKVILKTKDDLDIVGDYYNLSTQKQGVLLLHMMPANRKSWWDLALKLEDNGFQVLAIDLRGHGESTNGPDGYKNFSNEEHQKSILDIEAALDFFKVLNIKLENIIIGGASIGANLALWYGSENNEIKKIFCLSPGINYREIKPLNFVNKLTSDQQIFIATSLDDKNNANESYEIFEKTPSKDKKIIIYKSAGHGTNMFYKNNLDEPNLIDEIIQWILK